MLLGHDTRLLFTSEKDVGTTVNFIIDYDINEHSSSQSIDSLYHLGLEEDANVIQPPLFIKKEWSKFTFLEPPEAQGMHDCACEKILIVDDNEFNVYSLRLLLDSLGY